MCPWDSMFLMFKYVWQVLPCSDSASPLTSFASRLQTYSGCVVAVLWGRLGFDEIVHVRAARKFAGEGTLARRKARAVWRPPGLRRANDRPVAGERHFGLGGPRAGTRHPAPMLSAIKTRSCSLCRCALRPRPRSVGGTRPRHCPFCLPRIARVPS